MITKDLDRTLERTAEKPQVKREADYYLKNIEKVKTIDDFLKNDRLYKFAMKAHGLEEMTYAKAFMRKVLTEGIAKADSFANKLTDPRYRKFAEAYDFAALGGSATIMDGARQGTVDKYVRQTLEEDAGNQNEGARLALYFARKAPELTSAYGILADKALIEVVQTALAIPSETSFMDIEKQAEMIEKKLGMKVTDLKDPAKLDKFLNRFTSLYELKNSSGGVSLSGNAATLFGGGGFGISASTLSAIQNLKMGGG